MHKTNILTARRSDTTAIAQIADLTGLFPGEMTSDLIEAFLSGSDDQIWLVIETDRKICGFVFARREELADRVWNMLALGVHPDQQGQSFGSTLVTALENTLRGREERLILVDTSGTDEFAKTRRFYEKQAYRLEGRIRDYWSEGDDKVMFAKTL